MYIHTTFFIGWKLINFGTCYFRAFCFCCSAERSSMVQSAWGEENGCV